MLSRVDEPMPILADPTRRTVVEVLRRNERSVGEIVARVDIVQSGVSRRRGILHNAGAVSMRPDGPRRLCSLEARPFFELEERLSGYRDVWQHRLHRLQGQLDQQHRGRRTAMEKKQ